MRTLTRRPSHTVTESLTRHTGAANGHPSNPRLRPQLVSDAVIAEYIHDISVRHRTESREAAQRAPGHSDARR